MVVNMFTTIFQVFFVIFFTSINMKWSKRHNRVVFSQIENVEKCLIILFFVGKMHAFMPLHLDTLRQNTFFNNRDAQIIVPYFRVISIWRNNNQKKKKTLWGRL